MNLVNMAQRQDENLVLSDSAVINKRTETPTLIYRGFKLESSPEPAILLKNVFKWYPFCSQLDETGWTIKALPVNDEFPASKLEVSLRDDSGSVLASKKIEVVEEATPVTLPKISIPTSDAERYHLALRLVKPRPSILSLLTRKKEKPNRAFLSIHKVMDRADILALCRGRGVELGPGHHPQVQPSSEVEVTYVEQTPPQEWDKLYNDTGNYDVKSKLWDNYQIGDACNLPVEDHSLDFIFSSHVFEHLANPLGHLKYWATKLQEGGSVICIVPDIAGCKDYVYRPSPMSEILAEQASGDMEPTLAHYARWAKYRRPNEDPKKYYDAKRSIHVHYYTKNNMEDVLQYAVEHLGYSGFEVRYTPNHKDFHFVLSK